jgi:hypothetical protein
MLNKKKNVMHKIRHRRLWYIFISPPSTLDVETILMSEVQVNNRLQVPKRSAFDGLIGHLDVATLPPKTESDKGA